MVKANIAAGVLTEDLLAELTAAAYRVALRHGIKGSFLDMQLELWREMRGVLGRVEETEPCRR